MDYLEPSTQKDSSGTDWHINGVGGEETLFVCFVV